MQDPEEIDDFRRLQDALESFRLTLIKSNKDHTTRFISRPPA